ncbi:MAG TPA: prepilin-type N-terminal cleavage/methylation domain-containing protein [Thermoleophilaceae bacterium]
MRLSDSRGFTLMELVVAMSLGMIVLLASFTVIDRAFITNKAVSDREDALARGRIALEQMTRQIRSMTCAGNNTPISLATDSEVDFYAYMGDPTKGGSLLPDLHKLTYDSTKKTIVETQYTVTSVNTTPPTVNATPYKNRTLLTNVVPVDANTPIFSYYTFDPDAAKGSGSFIELDRPAVAAADLPTVVKVSINYLTMPTGIKVNDPHSTTFQDDVFWRAIDPETPNAQPCSQGVS